MVVFGVQEFCSSEVQTLVRNLRGNVFNFLANAVSDNFLNFFNFLRAPRGASKYNKHGADSRLSRVTK